MKRRIIILGLGLVLCNFAAQCYEYNRYNNGYPPYSYYSPDYCYNRYYNSNFNNDLLNRKYYRYRNFYPYYYNNVINYNNISKIKQRQRIRKLRRKLKNRITWFNNNNNNNNGVLTGYSVPIQKNTINNSNQSIKPPSISPLCDTDLFNKGTGNTKGYSKGIFGKGQHNDNTETGAKTGVTIIYD